MRPSRKRPVSERERDLLYGIHPVQEALDAGGRRIERIWVARERLGPRVGRLLRRARHREVPVSYLPRRALERIAGPGAVHQGVVAEVAAFAYADPGEVCRQALAEPGSLLLVLDRIEDPRNLGSVVRTAAATQACGVILAAGGSAGLTAVAAKASAGAIERIPVARDGRLPARLRELRAGGFRILGLDPRGPVAWDAVDWTGRVVLVAGGEGRGLRPGVLAACSERVALPVARGVESLNVAVAVSVVLYEALRQRRRGRAPGNSADKGT